MSHALLAFSSLLLFIVSAIYAGKIRKNIISRGLYSSMVFAFLMLSAFFIVSDYFTGEGIDSSIIYHLKYGLSGAGFGEYHGIIGATFALFIMGVGLSIIAYKITARRSCQNQPRISFYTAYLCISAAIIANPAAVDLFLLSRTDGDHHFLSYYKNPQISSRPKNRFNLVYIYAESLERTYFDEALFPGLIKGLRDLEAKSTYFTNIRDVFNTGWTVAGITAGQCGIPLVAPSHGNSMSGMDKYLVGATCLGDLLKNEGYELSYMGGAPLNFAGKGKFFETHGFSSVRGLKALTPLVPDQSYQTAWGLYDDSLLDIALDQFNRSSRSGKPFGLFLLTLDTHHPYGRPSKSCGRIIYKDGSNPILNSVACSDYLISKFANKILKSPHAKNTVLVISSDHISMRNSAIGLLTQGDRKNLFMVINARSKGTAKITKVGTSLDIGPTLLRALGYEGTIGLGRDLLGDEIPIISQVENIDESLKGWSTSLMSFWDFPRVNTNIRISATNMTIQINGRKFGVPALVEFNEELDTKMKFEFGSDRSHKRLVNHVLELDWDTPILWVDNCSTINQGAGKGGLCVLVAKPGADPIINTRINGSMEITIEDLKKVIGLQTKPRGNRN